MRRLSRLQNHLLTVGAVLGALCLLAAIAAVLIGAKPLVFRSGSMAPAIPTGALGLSVPVEAAGIRAGDIISVETATGVRVTHRVVSAEISGGTASVTLKGDANSIPDAAPYVLQEADRVVAHAPFLGYAVGWLNSSAAMFAGGLFTAYLLYLAFGGRGRRPSRPDASQPQATDREQPPDGDRPADGPRAGHHGRRAMRLTALSVAGLSALAGGALHAAAPSQAAFNDAGTAAGSFQAAQLPVPTLTCTQGRLGFLADNSKVELTWLHNNGSVGVGGYELTTQIGSGPESAGQPFGASTTALTLNAGSINSSSSTPVTIRIYSTYSVWRSTPHSAVANYVPAQLGGLVAATLNC